MTVALREVTSAPKTDGFGMALAEQFRAALLYIEAATTVQGRNRMQMRSVSSISGKLQKEDDQIVTDWRGKRSGELLYSPASLL